MQRDLDVVVFGASGDTGTVACCLLFFRGRELGLSSWAPAARNLAKLRSELLDQLPPEPPAQEGLAPSEAIEADAGDHESLLRMCARAKCVVACAGPYAQYGEGVVKACVEAGTHYVDVTGEVPWVQKMERKYGEEAERKGVTLVSCAGYDSVPPDIATFLAAKSLEREGESLRRFEAFLGAGGGAMPTGTINTVVAGVAAGKSSFLKAATCGMLGGEKKRPRVPVESAALLPKSGKTYVPKTEAANLSRNLFWTFCPGYSSLAGIFCLPSFMAPININVVHRTAVQMGYSGLEYRERTGGLPSGPLSLYGLLPTMAGVAGAALLGLFIAMPYSGLAMIRIRDAINPPYRHSVRTRMLEGCKPTGRTTLQGFGVSCSGNMTVKVRMGSDYDAGLGFTMLSACTMAGAIVQRTRTGDTARAGFNTPVTALGGEALAEALKSMGVELEVSTQRLGKL